MRICGVDSAPDENNSHRSRGLAVVEGEGNPLRSSICDDYRAEPKIIAGGSPTGMGAARFFGWGLFAGGASRASSRARSWTEHELWSANPLSGLVKFEGRRPRVSSPYPAFWHLNAIGALAMGAGFILQGLVTGHYPTGLYGAMLLSIGISLWTGFKMGEWIKGPGATRNEQ